MTFTNEIVRLAQFTTLLIYARWRACRGLRNPQISKAPVYCTKLIPTRPTRWIYQ
jgi:hypothetical protein